MPRRGGVSIRTTAYGQFKGVDFSTDPSLVDTSRSPLAVNLLADAGGMPEKRPGWRTLWQLEGPIYGLFSAVLGGKSRFLAHAGTAVYAWSEGEAPAVLRTGVHPGRSAAAELGGRLWLLTGGEYLVYDGESLAPVAQAAYIPTTVIGASPAGGGEVFEDPNLLQPKRKNEFIPDGVSREYCLDSAGLDDVPVTVTVRGEELKQGEDFTVDLERGVVTFAAAPAAPAAGQEGEVIVTFSKTVEGYGERIARCAILTTFGVGADDRLVVSGNPDFPNRDWTSALGDPTYFPDLGYGVVGSQSTPILGYRRLGEELAIVKGDNGQDSTVFLRSAALSDDGGQVLFQTRRSIAGVGAVSRGGFGSILDEQLFLSTTGVYALTTNVLTAQRIVQNRSFYVDPKLTREENLDRAEAVSWNGMYLLAINSRVYILDGRQSRSYRSRSQSEYVYECYYWENVPAACWLDHRDGAEETLYFGTADGRICRFSTDRDAMTRYADDGAAIRAVWATKADDDGDVTLCKTMLRRGCSVTIKPYARSSAQICFRTEQDPVEWPAAEDTLDIFDWEDVDFSRFTFEANDAPREVLFRTPVRRYKRLQIIVKNNVVNEGFGIFGITKHYVVGNFAKR